jgi:hypothetical protein
LEQVPHVHREVSRELVALNAAVEPGNCVPDKFFSHHEQRKTLEVVSGLVPLRISLTPAVTSPEIDSPCLSSALDPVRFELASRSARLQQ